MNKWIAMANNFLIYIIANIRDEYKTEYLFFCKLFEEGRLNTASTVKRRVGGGFAGWVNHVNRVAHVGPVV